MERRNFIFGSSAGLLALGAPAAFGQSGGGQASGARLQAIRARGTLRVGTTGDFEPMSFRIAGAAEYRGLDIDAMAQFAADIGVRVEWVATEWGRFVAALRDNRFDIFSGASVTPAREAQIAFADPYFEFSSVPVVSRLAALRLKSWDDMNAPGVRVAVTAGTAFEEAAKRHFPRANVRALAAPSTGYREVLDGLADLALTSNVDAAMLVKRNRQLVLTDAARDPRDRRPAAFGLPPDDPDWRAAVNGWVKAKSDTGFFKSLEAKWLAAA
ncbi:MAG: substrate-binding periplasmic protein [Rhodospirillales bacterium]|jgi:cyclohexadienyl dehydratase